MAVTKTGFEFDVCEEALDDFELLEGLSEMEEGGVRAVTAVTRVLKALLGEEQTKALKEHCRNESGRVSITAITAELSDIFTSLGEDKKK